MISAVKNRKRTLQKRFVLFVLFSLGIAFLSYYKMQKDTSVRLTRSVSLCTSLRGIPFGEDLGLIKRVSNVSIPQIQAPYNPGFIAYKDGFFLVFRHDVKAKERIYLDDTLMPFRTYIRGIKLDRNFQPLSSPVRVDTGSDFSEDPRLFELGDQIYITYNDVEDPKLGSRTIRISQLDPDTLQMRDPVNLAQYYQKIEKNWVPFVCTDKDGPHLHFEYCFNPHVIFRMEDPNKNELSHLVMPNHVAVQKMPWKDSWGVIRGGTPPILVDGQYLSFFHSFFREKKKVWYVMGAYTFESSFPFRITSCSALPIQFRGIYNTNVINTACSDKFVIYPSGAVLSQEDGREVLHVACGENDCAIKIITFDKEALLNSLQPIPLYQKNQENRKKS